MRDYQAFLREVERSRHLPFVWGQNDCILFSDRCYFAFTGEHFAQDLMGLYDSPKTAVKAMKEGLLFELADSIEDCFDKRLRRFDGAPGRGCVVMRPAPGELLGAAFGVCVGAKNAFMSETGVVFVYVEPFQPAWGPK